MYRCGVNRSFCLVSSVGETFVCKDGVYVYGSSGNGSFDGNCKKESGSFSSEKEH